MYKAEDNLKLVYFTINKYFKSWKNRDFGYFDEDDLVSIGTIALIESCNKYNEELGCKFTTYAVKNIWSKITRFLEDKHFRSRTPNKKIKETISLERENSEGISIQDTFLDETSDINFQTTLYFDEFLELLTKYEKKLLILKLNGMKQGDIAKQVNKQQSVISRDFKIIKKKYEQYESGEEITIKVNRRKKPILCVETGEIFKDTKEIANKFNMNRGVIYNILCRNNRGKYRGFTFRYVEE